MDFYGDIGWHGDCGGGGSKCGGSDGDCSGGNDSNCSNIAVDCYCFETGVKQLVYTDSWGWGS